MALPLINPSCLSVLSLRADKPVTSWRMYNIEGFCIHLSSDGANDVTRSNNAVLGGKSAVLLSPEI